MLIKILDFETSQKNLTNPTEVWIIIDFTKPILQFRWATKNRIKLNIRW